MCPNDHQLTCTLLRIVRVVIKLNVGRCGFVHRIAQPALLRTSALISSALRLSPTTT